MDIWYEIQSKHRTSIVQIFATHGAYNIPEPYMVPTTRDARGSGFLISKEGHIITNAHVVASLITLSFRAEQSGNQDLDAELIAICPAKDVALLKASPEALKELGQFTPMQFGDDHKIHQMQPVMAGGFPLGRERIKFTAGVASGYEAPETEDGSSSQSYIQVDLVINPGSSGGPLITTDGKVVGINSAGVPSKIAQNTNFAIPARVVLSIMRELFAREHDLSMSKVVLPPTLGLTFQRVTTHHFSAAGFNDPEDQIGMRVKEIIPGTPFTDVKPGDIIQTIQYADPYHVPESFEIEMYRSDVCLRCNDAPDTEIIISRTANIKVMNLETNQEAKFTQDRKVTLQEVIDTIPVDTILILEVMRPSAKNIGNTREVFRNKNGDMMIQKLFPPFDKLDYLLFGGAVFIPLSVNVLNVLGTTKYLCEFMPFKARYKPRVMITKIFPNTDIREIDSINPTEIIKSVNGQKISDLEQIRQIISSVKQNRIRFVTIMFRSGKELVLDINKAIEQDKVIHEKFEIKPDKFTSQLWK